MEQMRSARVERQTKETQIDLTLNLDGEGSYTINTGIPFFNHLLELFAKHGRFDLTIHAEGDIEVDFHPPANAHMLHLDHNIVAPMQPRAVRLPY